MTTVSFQQAAKFFGTVAAVSDLTLDIADGEFMVLVVRVGQDYCIAPSCRSGGTVVGPSAHRRCHRRPNVAARP